MDVLELYPHFLVQNLVHAAVDAFIFNDLFAAVRRFLVDARGSFGLALTCTLDSNTVVLVRS